MPQVPPDFWGCLWLRERVGEGTWTAGRAHDVSGRFPKVDFHFWVTVCMQHPNSTASASCRGLHSPLKATTRLSPESNPVVGAAHRAWRAPAPNPRPRLHWAGGEAQAVITACLPGRLRPTALTRGTEQLPAIKSS